MQGKYIKSNDIENLNEMQKKAVLTSEGPLLILAGAGSGKTKTMTHRIAYLIQEKGVSPYNILAVTFTNKAAQEMRERVEQLIGSHTNMWIMTFHSACMRILRQHIEALGYSKDFTVYDSTDQKTVIKDALKYENLDEKMFSVPYIQKIIGDCKDKGKTPSEYEEETAIGSKDHKIAQVYKYYENTLKRNNALDFDDLILKTVRLFEENPDILAYYQDKFKYIMVDEYQDTNYTQYRFINLLAQKNKNICVVGDDDQCIYQWRGADIRNILDFEKDFPDANIIKLEQNYRSTATILEAAHNVIKNNAGRKHKKLWTDNVEGEKIKYYKAYSEKDEAFFIAKEIERLKGPGKKYSDFAILYRTHAQSRTFEEALTLHEIPYRIFGGLRFYDRKEVKDLMAYMKLVQNHVDDISIKRVINEPKRGIGAKTVEKLENLALVRNESLFDILKDEEIIEGQSEKISKGLQSFVSCILKYHESKDVLKVSEIYEGLLNDTGYLLDLENQNTVESKGRIENLQEFKSVIFDYENNSENSNLFEFLETMSLVTDIDNYDPSEDAVLLMTLHSAKGLEFPVVFMPGMEEGLFPGRRAFESLEGLEEERRLCYVGITRAKERLYMTHAEERMLYGRTEYTAISGFLKEIDKELFDNWEENKITQTFSQKKECFSPTDQMKYLKPKVQAENNNISKAEIKTGDKVKHKKFGKGMVVTVDGNNTATIVFEEVGIKNLALDLAPLEKI